MGSLPEIVTKKRNFPLLSKIESLLSRFSTTERYIFYFLTILLALSSIILLFRVNDNFLVEVPTRGGSLTEGIVGYPRFINPLLSLSSADRDLTSLVYSGLIHYTAEGDIINSLAESIHISEDATEYAITLKEGITFHDGEPVTTEDVVFTLNKVQDPLLKSPKFSNWEGVTHEALSDREIIITLREPYIPFIENLTLGILPKHIWSKADTDQFTFSQFNIDPIGSGPYKISHTKRNSAGLPVFYDLSPFENYALGEPLIDTLKVRFYPNESDAIDALIQGEIESISNTSPEQAVALSSMGLSAHSTPLPRIFAVFLNQSQATVFTRSEVREALNLALNKERIVEEVLKGFGRAIDGPIPQSLLATETTSPEIPEGVSQLEYAKTILAEAGWEPTESGVLGLETDEEEFLLSFSISTSNIPNLVQTAERVKEDWEALGADIEIKIFETGDLNQNVIRQRKYNTLLFGEIIGRSLDLYPFWHSSQRNDPGLNVALYANIAADGLLEDIREEKDKELRYELHQEFTQEVTNEIPAIFTYSPDFIYFLPDKVHNFKIQTITTAEERFLNVHEWFIETDHVWKIFTNDE
jgi:peptide/nickel transport system substrate-binding protein